jgi:hypothetical protein
MAQSSNSPGLRSPRTDEERAQLRAQGLRPVEYWVPDLDNPEVLAQIRREAKLMSQHPQNAELDEWLDKAIDWDEWK